MLQSLMPFLLVSNFATAADDPQVAECRAARKMVAEICPLTTSRECKIKNESEHDEVVKLLKNAPLGGQTINTADIKALLSKVPTKDTINDLLVKLSGSCEANTYFKLASALGQYHLKEKAPKQIQQTKDTVKEWMEKDMRTDYPTLLSLLVRTNVATQYAKSNVIQVSDAAKKELDQMVEELRTEAKKFTPEPGVQDPAKKWDPKTWQAKIKDELETTKKYANRWLAWLEQNWK